MRLEVFALRLGTAGVTHEMNNQMLTAILSVAGVRNGYDEVHAEFAPFRDFKVKWTRSYRWISFEVSDYLGDAPEAVIESLANTIFKKIKGDGDSLYTDVVCEWVTSDQFLKSKQPVFVRRFRGLSLSTVGEHRDLAESYNRLVNMGLVDRDPDLFMGWTHEVRSRAVGRASVLMRVVAMSDILDSPDVSDDLMDYCLYTQVAHVGMGFRPGGISGCGAEYDELLSRFPDRQRMDQELRRIGMHV